MAAREEFWIDHLREKHECFSYDELHSLTMNVEGVVCSVLVPDFLPTMRVLVAAPQGELLFVFGTIAQKFDDKPVGFVLVARQNETGTYRAVIWHETYPYAVEELGLSSD